MKQRYEIAVIGSGFAGSLLARVLARLGYDVVLLERGTHPRFAIGESSTPLANLSLERLAARYDLDDCYALAAHGRWLAKYPQFRRGLKRGFTFYRHHPDTPFANRGLDSERLLVAASPHGAIADSHWFRADVDQHFVRQAARAGVEYFDRIDIDAVDFLANTVRLAGKRNGAAVAIDASFVIDASGPGGLLVRQLAIPSDLQRTHTRAGLVFSHFDHVRLMHDVVSGLPEGPYPDDWAAVHHVIDEGWMYSLRFDHGTTSAGFLLTTNALENLQTSKSLSAEALWHSLLGRYPTIASLFSDAKPTMPIAFRPLIQHRLARAVGDRWLLMPHAYAFVDPLFSTGIAWSLRAVERVGLIFEHATRSDRMPHAASLERYGSMLSAEADQIDLLVAGAYKAMAHFDLFTAQSMLYFAAVSYAEASQRLLPDESVAWRGFLGVGDPALEQLPREALNRLNALDSRGSGNEAARAEFVDWVRDAIRPRNVAGLADPRHRNLYPVDFDALVEGHDLLGISRGQLVAALPALRGAQSRDFATSLHSSGARPVEPSPLLT